MLGSSPLNAFATGNPFFWGGEITWNKYREGSWGSKGVIIAPNPFRVPKSLPILSSSKIVPKKFFSSEGVKTPNPFRAPKSLPILTSSKLCPKRFPVVTALRSR